MDYSEGSSTCSEWVCLNKIKKTTNIDYNKLILVNVRIDREGSVRNSRPCKSCESLLKALQPKKVYYTNDNGEFEEYL